MCMCLYKKNFVAVKMLTQDCVELTSSCVVHIWHKSCVVLTQGFLGSID